MIDPPRLLYKAAFLILAQRAGSAEWHNVLEK